MLNNDGMNFLLVPNANIRCDIDIIMLNIFIYEIYNGDTIKIPENLLLMCYYFGSLIDPTILEIYILIYQRRFIRREVPLFGFVMNDKMNEETGQVSDLIISFCLSRLQAYNPSMCSNQYPS